MGFISGKAGIASQIAGHCKPIVGTADTIFVSDAELDQVDITTADSTAWIIADDAGATLSSGTLTYIALLPIDGYDTLPGWYANVTWPTTPQRVHVHPTITKSTFVYKRHLTLDIVDFS